MFLAPTITQEIIERVRQIANEIDAGYTDEYYDMPLEVLAFRLKLLAAKKDCYIGSWVYYPDAAAKCYSYGEYFEGDEDTWVEINADSEPEAIIIAFKWLADKQYFTKG